uniref:SH3 domain-containing protein n=1 Tax=Taeniopygia guttata TaxID=59729 RepID=A0A674G821_TAEGU
LASVYLMTLFLCLGSMCPLTTGIFMEKLTSKKLMYVFEYTNSLARAEEDYNASDCSFINIKKEDSGEFWAASVRYENYMGTVGYFPSSSVSEQHVYQEASQPVPTRVRNLQRPSWLHNYIWIFSVHSERKERFLPG